MALGFGAGSPGADAGCIFVLVLFLCKKQKQEKLLGMIVDMAYRKTSVQAGGCA